VIIRQIVNTVFRSCSYVISHEGCSWLVDCGDLDQILPQVDGKLQGVLLTHAHFDHIYGLNSLMILYPGLSVYTNQAGLDTLLNDKLNFSRYYGEPIIFNEPDRVKLVEDREWVELFDGIRAQTVFTPGHSPCCVTWIIDDALFTGDSFIPGVKTVTNIPHSNKDLAAESEALIRELAEHRTIYSGHAPEIQ
jgi:glyoxylase-like metal-dependent hydrolase (beta-lactamase superfamily II)